MGHQKETHMTHQWYALQISTNQEKKTSEQITEIFTRNQRPELLGRILMPTETELVLRNGQKKLIERKLFPGYLFVQLAAEEGGGSWPAINQEAWYLVKTASKVLGFIGGTPDSPKPLNVSEIQQYIDPTEQQQKPKTKIQKGQNVRVVDGPFKDFIGVVQVVDVERGNAEVAVQVFGRATNVSFSIHDLILE